MGRLFWPEKNFILTSPTLQGSSNGCQTLAFAFELSYYLFSLLEWPKLYPIRRTGHALSRNNNKNAGERPSSLEMAFSFSIHELFSVNAEKCIRKIHFLRSKKFTRFEERSSCSVTRFINQSFQCGQTSKLYVKNQTSLKDWFFVCMSPLTRHKRRDVSFFGRNDSFYNPDDK